MISKEDIEAIRYAENMKKFCQTESTPVMMLLLVEKLDFLGDSKSYEEILAGTFNILASINKFAKACIKVLKKLANIINVPKAILTTDLYRSG